MPFGDVLGVGHVVHARGAVGHHGSEHALPARQDGRQARTVLGAQSPFPEVVLENAEYLVDVQAPADAHDEPWQAVELPVVPAHLLADDLGQRVEPRGLQLRVLGDGSGELPRAGGIRRVGRGVQEAREIVLRTRSFQHVVGAANDALEELVVLLLVHRGREHVPGGGQVNDEPAPGNLATERLLVEDVALDDLEAGAAESCGLVRCTSDRTAYPRSSSFRSTRRPIRPEAPVRNTRSPFIRPP